jgi:hypothetical protein
MKLFCGLKVVGKICPWLWQIGKVSIQGVVVLWDINLWSLFTVPIDRILSVKNARAWPGSQWISHKINIRHPGQWKK